MNKHWLFVAGANKGAGAGSVSGAVLGVLRAFKTLLLLALVLTTDTGCKLCKPLVLMKLVLTPSMLNNMGVMQARTSPPGLASIKRSWVLVMKSLLRYTSTS